MNTSMQSLSDRSFDGNRSYSDSNQSKDNCVSLMISHLIGKDENIKVWGVPVKFIKIVAVVSNIEVDSYKLKYEFRDETGQIDGFSYISLYADHPPCAVSKNSYATVHGKLRNLKGQNCLYVLSIQPLENLNELLAHLMEVTLICLEGKHAASNNNKSQNQVPCTTNENPDNSGSDRLLVNNYLGLGKEQALILTIIESSEHEYGAERNEIKSKVPLNMVSKVDGILNFLSSEGHIYTTKTDDFFKKI
ncbi:hypothetical protein TKK_0012375 [Trichogramma kaykai]|uniref:Replication protein A C-terminal domain-containing protein n=1 Tax=Trichogramma kaykai TaxID=54128 RepID=A0ABD2WPA5_9HYME